MSALRNPWGKPRGLALVTWLYIAWSIVPVLLAIRFAFNQGRSRTEMQGWSLRWFFKDPVLSVVHDPTLLSALRQSLLLAALAMLIAVPLGTALALGLQRWRGPASGPVNVLMLLPLVTPELVFAVGMFLLFTTAFSFVGLGTPAQVIGHVTFSVSFVVLIVRGRLATIGPDVEEAAADLGAPPHEIVRRILLPLLAPAMAASLLIVFALSIDDFVVAQYLASGADTTTVPMRIYAQARGAPTPALNALATIMLGVTLLTLALAYLVLRAVNRGGRRGAALEQLATLDSGERGPVTRGEIQLEGLAKAFGGVVAVDAIDQHIPGGEFFTMLGPSGCGKTTTLRLIAGFERPDAGAIRLDGVDLSGTPPHKRPVNTVFQSYALFPHMTVRENVAFGLRYKKATKAEVSRRAGEAMAMVRLDGLESRRPGQLSGGQQQRVALARALVLEPPVLLLDEPLGALDARLRVDLQVELKRIQEALGITFVYVTHDQDEALTMSDRVAVMRAGRIEQCGDPQSIYEEPATAFVANFLGSSNLIPATVTADGDGCRLGLGAFNLRAAHGAVSSGDALAMIRPERVRLGAHGEAGENRLPGMVEEVVYLGFHRELRVRLATGALVKANEPNDGSVAEYRQGDPVSVYLPADCLRVLAADGTVTA